MVVNIRHSRIISFTVGILVFFIAICSSKNIYSAETQTPKKTKKRKIDPDEAEDNSPPSYTWKSEKAKIFEKRNRSPYGYKTTKYFYFKDIMDTSGKIKYRFEEDPLLEDLHKYTLIEKYDYKLQDLGIDGTAARRLFYKLPKQIGVTTGLKNFDLYGIDLDDLKIYDTKSPYTNIYIIPLKKHSMINVDFSQNITRLWNIGGSFYYFSVARPYDQYPTSKHIMSRNWDIYTHFKTENEDYHIIISFISAKHYMKEVYVSKGKELKEYFKYDKKTERITAVSYPFPIEYINMDYPYNGKEKLYKESNGGRGKNLLVKSFTNIYQQFKVYPDVYLYHQIGWTHARSSLGEKDSDEIPDSAPKRKVPLRSVTTHDIGNEVGAKTELFDSLFIRFYLKRRDVLRRYDHLLFEKDKILKNKGKRFAKTDKEVKDKISKHVGENSLGTKIIYDITEDKRITNHLEYLIPKYYKVESQYVGSLADFSIGHAKVKTPFIYETFITYSGQPGWTNPSNPRILFEKRPKQLDFVENYGLKLETGVRKNFSIVYVRPSIEYTSVGPKLLDLSMMISPGIDLNFKFGDFYWDNNIILSFNLRSQRQYSAPILFLNSNFYYKNRFFRKKLELVSGLLLHYKTSYAGVYYDTMGYFIFKEDSLNSSEKIGGYPILNIFTSLRYEHFSIFVKITHINQGFPKKGYFATDKYPGQSRSYDFGVSWYFFD